MLVFPEAVVSDGVVASAIVTAPPNVLAPVEVRKVPDEPEKSLAVEPVAVNPFLTTCPVKVLFVSSWVAVNVTTVSEVLGNVIVVPSVPAKVMELFTVSVLALAIVSVALEEGLVIVTLL